MVVGSVRVPIADIFRTLGSHLAGHSSPTQADSIIWNLRLPRVILGIVAGAGLSVAGGILQTLVKNPLAEPYLLGINSGASVGAALSMLFGIGMLAGVYSLQLAAIIGALVATILMFSLVRSGGGMTAPRLLMAGVAVSYTLSAATSFLVFASDNVEGARSLMFWLLGSLGLGKLDGVLGITTAVVVLITVGVTLRGRKVDALLVDDATASTLGVHPARTRQVLLAAVCILVGTLVALVGSIGFIGLVAPHLARRLVGGSHRYMIPTAALLGSIVLVVADIAARSLFAPQEVPIGVITAFVGAPFLFALVRTTKPVA